MPKPNKKKMSEEEYIVEEIIGKRRKKDKVEYLVKWEGYPEDESTWETLANLKNVMEMVEEYENNSMDTKKLSRVSPQSKKQVIKPKPPTLTRPPIKKSPIHEPKHTPKPQIHALSQPIPVKEVQTLSLEPSLQISFEAEDDSEEMPEYGDFRFGDHPKRVVSCKPEGENIMLVVEWYPRSNGKIPLNTIMPSSTVRKRDPNFLIEYYESKLQFSSKVKAKNVKPLIIQRDRPSNDKKKQFVVNVKDRMLDSNNQGIEMSSSSKKPEIQKPKNFKFTSLIEDARNETISD